MLVAATQLSPHILGYSVTEKDSNSRKKIFFFYKLLILLINKLQISGKIAIKVIIILIFLNHGLFSFFKIEISTLRHQTKLEITVNWKNNFSKNKNETHNNIIGTIGIDKNFFFVLMNLIQCIPHKKLEMREP